MQKFIFLLAVLLSVTALGAANNLQTTDVLESPSSHRLQVSQSWHNEPDNKEQVRHSKAEQQKTTADNVNPSVPVVKKKKCWLLSCICGDDDDDVVVPVK